MAIGAGPLWRLTLNINSEFKGFPETYWIAEQTEALAKQVAIDIANQRRKVLPTDASIFFAKIAKWDTRRDSRYLLDAIGDGLYQDPGAPATPAKYDYSATALLVRMENNNGTSFSRKFSCIPDAIITGGVINAGIISVTSTPMAPIAPDAAGATWYAMFSRLLHLIAASTHHVESGFVPGDPYTYYPFNGAYVMRVSQKKGARVFS